MPGSETSDTPDEIGRLYDEVRALQAQIAARDERVAPRNVTGVVVGVAAGVLALAGGAFLLLTMEVVSLPSWDGAGRMMASRAAVGIVERIFTVY
ncbi:MULTISPECIES: hypothetical protein [Sphingomonas]|uniref:Uncharacterized protein n=2 Tax=Sphingomonas TaxID=13687 RepID=A0A7W9BS42_9SPHN|nr:hypothetical protein [Sphingomonas prati]MBB5729010.1 hypothetical protein [Sphingomonas prati]